MTAPDPLPPPPAPLRPRPMLFGVALVVFLGWLGFLFYLYWTQVVLHR